VTALAFAALFTYRGMAPGLRPNTIQDDARQHIFWLQKYRDPELFRGDLIADYFEAVAPLGYKGLYWLLVRAVEPLVASKLLPPVLGLVAVGLTYGLVRALHPWAGCAFLASVLLGWHVWQLDDVVSGTPRAFALPLLLAVVWALVAGRALLAGLLVGGLGLMYSQVSLVGLGLLAAGLVRWRHRRPGLVRERRPWLALALAIALVAAAVLPVLRQLDRFGPVVTASVAREMPEFQTGGRLGYFTDDRFRFWIASNLSGLDLRARDRLLGGFPVLFELALLATPLPLLVLTRRGTPLVAALSPRTIVLVELLAVSVALFFLAHLLVFRLHFPNRYVKTSLQIILACSAGLGLGLLIQLLVGRFAEQWRMIAAGGLTLAFATGLALYPAGYVTYFVRDEHPRISAYVRGLPKDTLIAGAPRGMHTLAAFGARPVFHSLEHALAFHLGYYDQMRERMNALVEAYYAESPQVVLDFADRYGVDLFVVDRRAYGLFGDWFWTYIPGSAEPQGARVRELLRSDRSFVLQAAASRCPLLVDGDVALVSRPCVAGL
jgi:hypothetical protein